jgi:hypothetical protein
MDGTRASSTLAALLLAIAPAVAGCCTPKAPPTTARMNRDTPEAALEFFRTAFLADETSDQFDSFHPEFVAEQGLSRGKYELARTLAPGTFEKARRLLGSARLDGEPEYAVLRTEKGERAAARLRVATDRGTATFLLVDLPQWEVSLSDPDLPRLHGPAAGFESSVRAEGDRLKVALDLPLDVPPLPGARVRRFSVHHDWLLWRIEALEGFEEFLGEVRATDEKVKETPR